ncbi:transcriptional regulator ATRX, partial [Trifolium medium]|nr:transcriptional regulator ATRX [Trifolium medium]
MGDHLGSFPESVQVRTKLAEKTRVDLWGQSVILKAVWDVTNGIRADLFQYDVVRGRTKRKL